MGLLKTVIFIVFANILLVSGAVNQWEEVTPTFIPPDFSPNATLGTYNSWAANRTCPKHNGIIWWGYILDSVRKSGIYANCILVWDVENSILSCPTAANYEGGTNSAYLPFALLPEFEADSTPCPRHPYNAFAYVDSLDAFYMVQGATIRMTRGDPDSALIEAVERDRVSTWKYSFLTDRWTRLNGYPGDLFSTGAYENHMFYWKSQHKLLYIENKNQKAALFDLQSETWSNYTPSNAPPFRFYGGRGVWDPVNEKAYMVQSDSFCVFDPSTRTYTALPHCPFVSGKGIAYLLDHNMIMAVGSETSRTAVYDIDSGTWTEVSCNEFSYPNGLYGYLSYDSITGRVTMNTARNTFYTMDFDPGTLEPEQEGEALQTGLAIHVHPNPFNPAVSLWVTGVAVARRGAPLPFAIYNTGGRLVHSGVLEDGKACLWNASARSSGIYLLRVKAESGTFTRKLVLQR